MSEPDQRAAKGAWAPGLDPDPARELAKEIGLSAARGEKISVFTAWVDRRLRTFLAQREEDGLWEPATERDVLEAEVVDLQGQVAALRGALEGRGHAEDCSWRSFSDSRGDTCSCGLSAALAPGAGEAAGRVLAAVGEYLDTHRKDGSKSGPAWSRMADAHDAFRGGEG